VSAHRSTQETLISQLCECRPEHHAASNHCQRHTCGLRDEWHGAAGAGVGFNDKHRVANHGELHVDEPAHVESVGNFLHVRFDGGECGSREILGRQRTGRIARVNSGFLDVFHHAANQDLAARITHGVDIDFSGVLQESVDEYGT